MRNRGYQVLRPGLLLPEFNTLQIIGGNLQNGVQMVQYASADASLSATYDPDVDTVYPTGMGNAWLWIDGVQQTDGSGGGRVLVRHDFAGFTDPLMGGDVYIAGVIRSITIASGPHAGESLDFYTVQRG